VHDCDILLRRPDVSIPQTENTRSTYAREAGAATKSNTVSARQSYSSNPKLDLYVRN